MRPAQGQSPFQAEAKHAVIPMFRPWAPIHYRFTGKRKDTCGTAGLFQMHLPKGMKPALPAPYEKDCEEGQ